MISRNKFFSANGCVKVAEFNLVVLKSFSSLFLFIQWLLFLVAVCAAPASAAGVESIGNKALQVWLQSSLEKVSRDAEPPADHALQVGNSRLAPIEVKLAQHEHESIQLVVRSADALKKVSITITDLIHEQGDVIPEEQVTVRTVGYVKSGVPLYRFDLPYHKVTWPDPLLASASADLSAHQAQPFWLTFYAQPDQRPGIYQGIVHLSIDGQLQRSIPISLTVWNFSLPTKPALKSVFPIYENRIQSSYQQFFPEWWSTIKSDYEGYLMRFYKQMIDYRLSPNINIDPDAPNKVFVHELNMDELDKPPVQSFAQPILPLLRSVGLSTFAVGPHAGTFGNNWPRSPEAINALVPNYRRYAEQLRAQGVFEDHYIYTYDEPQAKDFEHVKQVMGMIRKADPELKNLVAFNGDLTEEQQMDLMQDADIIVYRNREFDPHIAEQFKSKGKSVWFYVSGIKPPYPALMIDYPSTAYRILPWMCLRFGLDGLLHWSVNYWRTNPFEEPDNTPWGGQYGSGVLFYPAEQGVIASIRLEALRDGFDDFDYLTLIKGWLGDRFGRGGNDFELKEEAKRLIVTSQFVQSMSQYEHRPEKFLAWRLQAGDLLDRISAFESTKIGLSQAQ